MGGFRIQLEVLRPDKEKDLTGSPPSITKCPDQRLWALQQTAATSSITTPAHSRATDTTLVWSSVLKVNVTPVPAMPITSEITPNGNTQRYQDFSVPPVAWASLSSVGRVSGSLGSPSLKPFKAWFWFSESCGKLLASLPFPQSKSGSASYTPQKKCQLKAFQRSASYTPDKMPNSRLLNCNVEEKEISIQMSLTCVFLRPHWSVDDPLEGRYPIALLGLGLAANRNFLSGVTMVMPWLQWCPCVEEGSPESTVEGITKERDYSDNKSSSVYLSIAVVDEDVPCAVVSQYVLHSLPHLHLTGIPRFLDRFDPADVRDAAMEERTGLAHKHTESQRGPLRFCRRERKRKIGREEGGEKHGGEGEGSRREGRKLNSGTAVQKERKVTNYSRQAVRLMDVVSEGKIARGDAGQPGECKIFKETFMKCLRDNSFDNSKCRLQSKEYLECRMEKDTTMPQMDPKGEPEETIRPSIGDEDGGGGAIILALTICSAAIGGTFQYGYNISIINAPTSYIQTFINDTYMERWGSESPRYLLIDRGDKEACVKALGRLRGGVAPILEVEEMLEEQEQQKSAALNSGSSANKTPWTLFKDAGLRSQLRTVMAASSAMMLCGNDSIYFYAYYIFLAAGIPPQKIQYITIGTGASEFTASILSNILIERVGRRYLLIGGYSLMSFWSVVFTVALNLQSRGVAGMAYLSMACVFAYILSFGLGPAGVSGILPAEIFDQSARPAAYMVAGSCMWISLFLVGMLFPFIVKGLGDFCFLPFFVVCVVSAVFLGLTLPETKGKTLAEITADFDGRNGKQNEYSDVEMDEPMKEQYQLGKAASLTNLMLDPDSKPDLESLQPQMTRRVQVSFGNQHSSGYHDTMMKKNQLIGRSNPSSLMGENAFSGAMTCRLPTGGADSLQKASSVRESFNKKKLTHDCGDYKTVCPYAELSQHREARNQALTLVTFPGLAVISGAKVGPECQRKDSREQEKTKNGKQNPRQRYIQLEVLRPDKEKDLTGSPPSITKCPDQRLWALQQTAATSSITTPAHSRATDTTLVWSSVLKVNVTPVPAMPITSEITPNGNTQRYQDFSVPPVAWASLSSVGRVSGSLGSPSLKPFKAWFWFSESCGKLLASLPFPQSKSGVRENVFLQNQVVKATVTSEGVIYNKRQQHPHMSPVTNKNAHDHWRAAADPSIDMGKEIQRFEVEEYMWEQHRCNNSSRQPYTTHLTCES
ncbi:hypothetical protein F7725_013930 [Dissostichus mawsoni]|uniref:CHCH domain-containing protein n=1 Tax=Dissostichus mawsoni TaxID=36200 RepID=A0A7J5YUI2_DISMA|nr:hypothetical protein F7725_013930 [Dissostichus mawsoni]